MKCKKCKRVLMDNSIFCNWCGHRQLKEVTETINVPAPVKLKNGEYSGRIMRKGKRVTVIGINEADYYRKAKAVKAGLLEIEDKAPVLTLDAAIDNYIDSRSEILSPSTIRGYRGIQKNRFYSVMKKDVHSIDNWQSVINDEAKAGSSPKTIRNSWRFIASVLRDSGVTPPVIILPQNIAAERAFLEPSEIKEYLNTIRGHNCEIPALLALHSLRQSELLALTWDCVDLSKKTITVHGSVVRDEYNQFVLKDTNKNETSRRSVPIFIPQLIEALQEVPVEKRTGRIITQHPATIRRDLIALRPDISLHNLRHSFCSLCYYMGISEKQCMAWGGWADFATMRRTYTHLATKDSTESEKLSAFYA